MIRYRLPLPYLRCILNSMLLLQVCTIRVRVRVRVSFRVRVRVRVRVKG